MKYIKKAIMGSFLIYAFNMIAINYNFVLPINTWTILFSSLFDVVGIAVLSIIKIIGV